MYSVHGGVLALLGAAVTSFLATNVDALAVLSPMLWSIPPGGRRYPALVGCLLGNTAVLALALLAAAGLAVLPEGQLRWVGVIPIAMGVYRLVARDGTDDAGGAADEEFAVPAAAVSDGADVAILTNAATGSGARTVADAGTNAQPTTVTRFDVMPVALPTAVDGAATVPAPAPAPATVTATATAASTKRTLLAHVGLTLALGGDNVAVLAPLLRAVGSGGSAVIAATHLVLFPLLLALPLLVARSRPQVPRLARPASACLSIVIGAVIIAG